MLRSAELLKLKAMRAYFFSRWSSRNALNLRD
jgi:hypothetical protein